MRNDLSNNKLGSIYDIAIFLNLRNKGLIILSTIKNKNKKNVFSFKENRALLFSFSYSIKIFSRNLLPPACCILVKRCFCVKYK